MKFGVYVHIPYCIQRCRYCDFTTFEATKMPPEEQYLDLLLKEISYRSEGVPYRSVSSVYFGGGTPSLFSSDSLLRVLDQLKEHGFILESDCEVTMEINPATLDKDKVNRLVNGGFNRFSVGVQSFNESLINLCGREHNVKDSLDTLELLNELNVKFSLDLLFGLPTQKLSDLKKDVEIAKTQGAHHISAYCLTVPEGHPMSSGRAPESEQVEMFEVLENELKSTGYEQYEISNFALPGYESQHNNLYWSNQAFWGIGLSAHSYFPEVGCGMRFWNPKSLDTYKNQVALKPSKYMEDIFPGDQFEKLSEKEALTDLCHMHLRTLKGLPVAAAHSVASKELRELLNQKMKTLVEKDWVEIKGDHFRLTKNGLRLSNQVYLELTF